MGQARLLRYASLDHGKLRRQSVDVVRLNCAQKSAIVSTVGFRDYLALYG
jgi:hypothetical protein